MNLGGHDGQKSNRTIESIDQRIDLWNRSKATVQTFKDTAGHYDGIPIVRLRDH